MSNQLLTKNFVAGAAINPNRIVTMGADDDSVIQGAAATGALIGVVEDVGPALGERCDVVVAGIAEVRLGGTVVRGGPVTSDATGQGVAAAPGAGANNRIIGFALRSGVTQDIVPVLVSPGSIQG